MKLMKLFMIIIMVLLVSKGVMSCGTGVNVGYGIFSGEPYTQYFQANENNLDRISELENEIQHYREEMNYDEHYPAVSDRMEEIETLQANLQSIEQIMEEKENLDRIETAGNLAFVNSYYVNGDTLEQATQNAEDAIIAETDEIQTEGTQRVLEEFRASSPADEEFNAEELEEYLTESLIEGSYGQELTDEEQEGVINLGEDAGELLGEILSDGTENIGTTADETLEETTTPEGTTQNQNDDENLIPVEEGVQDGTEPEVVVEDDMATTGEIVEETGETKVAPEEGAVVEEDEVAGTSTINPQPVDEDLKENTPPLSDGESGGGEIIRGVDGSYKTSGGKSITRIGGGAWDGNPGMVNVGEGEDAEPMYYDGTDFVEPDKIVRIYTPSETEGEEGTWTSVGYVNYGEEGEEGTTQVFNAKGNPMEGTPYGGEDSGYTQYGNPNKGGFVLDKDGNDYFSDGQGGMSTQDGQYTLIEGTDGEIERKEYAYFKYNILRAGKGYLELGSKLAKWTGVDTWETGEKILNEWLTTKKGFTAKYCERWTDGTNWPANYMLGDDGFPAMHIEGEIVNYTWINESDLSKPPELIKVFKISFEVNPKEEFTDDEYIEFTIVVSGDGSKTVDLNGDEEGGEVVRLKVGSESYSKKGVTMILRTDEMEDWDKDYDEVCLKFTNDFNYPYNRDDALGNKKFCNSFVNVEEGLPGFGDGGFLGDIFGLGNGESSSGSSGGSEEEGEQRW